MLTLSPEEISELLKYDSDTGKLFWKIRPRKYFASDRDFKWWNNRFSDKEAFTSDNGEGYRVGCIQKVKLKAHRVIWTIVYGVFPNSDIDHINGDKSDNRLANLRLVSRQENSKNQKRRVTNTSGVTGVYWYPRYEKWVAKINNKTLGYFTSIEEAYLTRKRFENNFNYHKNHGRFTEI